MPRLVLPLLVPGGGQTTSVDRPAGVERGDDWSISRHAGRIHLAHVLARSPGRVFRAKKARRWLDRDRVLRGPAGVHWTGLGKAPADSRGFVSLGFGNA